MKRISDKMHQLDLSELGLQISKNKRVELHADSYRQRPTKVGLKITFPFQSYN